MEGNIEIYEELRKDGHTEEQALKEAKAFTRASSSNVRDVATKSELKIALLEFAKEYKLDLLNFKINLLMAGVTAGFGYMFKLLIDILARLPK